MNQERLMKVLLSPHVSEKSTMAADQGNQFVFKVVVDATKPEIKGAVESLFNVEVENVTLCNVRGKLKRHGASEGRRARWKKAYVRLKAGQDIDFMGAE
ncbi:MAG: 50S ribosomal protein L23 [Gammaproteobacteria bacterium]|nr:50S ribosomal protein L23 [Gammaproteobacteria bacterium]